MVDHTGRNPGLVLAPSPIQGQWLMFAIPTPGKLRQEESLESQATLSHSESLSQKPEPRAGKKAQ